MIDLTEDSDYECLQEAIEASLVDTQDQDRRWDILRCHP